jgi:hypothetical protein
MEVEREHVRVAATEDMTAAKEAARCVRSRLQVVQRSTPGTAGDPMCTALMDELLELIARVEDSREYETTGRASVWLRQLAQAAARRRLVEDAVTGQGRGPGLGRCTQRVAGVLDSGNGEDGEEVA